MLWINYTNHFITRKHIGEWNIMTKTLFYIHEFVKGQNITLHQDSTATLSSHPQRVHIGTILIHNAGQWFQLTNTFYIYYTIAVWLHPTVCMFKSSLSFRNLLSFEGFEILICNKSLGTGISQHKSGINPVENYSLGIYLFVSLFLCLY